MLAAPLPKARHIETGLRGVWRECCQCQRLARAEFTTLRMRLVKIGARIAETASRVRIAFAAAHPEAALFASLARSLYPAGP